MQLTVICDALAHDVKSTKRKICGATCESADNSIALRRCIKTDPASSIKVYLRSFLAGLSMQPMAPRCMLLTMMSLTIFYAYPIKACLQARIFHTEKRNILPWLDERAGTFSCVIIRTCIKTKYSIKEVTIGRRVLLY